MIKHLNLTVKGRVQGVWFRASTKEQAVALGIKGFVRNMVNGDVYIEAEGSLEQLQSFVIWCKIGPPLAHVTELIEQKGELENFTSFKIR